MDSPRRPFDGFYLEEEVKKEIKITDGFQPEGIAKLTHHRDRLVVVTNKARMFYLTDSLKWVPIEPLPLEGR